MEQAADILKHVETPLQLTAVALLAIYGIAKALIATDKWTPSDRIVTLFLNRAFAFGLVALVLAVGGPLIAHAIDADDLIDGSVYGPDAMPIRSATVSAPPVGAQPVNYDGSFELRIPNHRKRDTYDITASADGYKPETRIVPRAKLHSVDFKLQAQPEHAIRQIMPDLVIAQYFGLPVVVLSMQVKSPGNTQAVITEMSARLTNGRVSVSMFPQAATIYSPMGPYEGVTGTIPIPPTVQKTFRFFLAPNANFSQLYRSIAALPDYDGRQPCAQSNNSFPAPLTDGAFDIIQSFANSKFIWTEGEWTLHFSITAGDQRDDVERSFDLAAADVEALRQSVVLLKSCVTNTLQRPLAQDGAIANYLVR